MSRREHRCGPDCTVCEAAIDQVETERDFPEPYVDHGGQDAYEHHLDQMAGSA